MSNYGHYKGYVASNQDPENLGRLQLIVPQIYGDAVYEYWALPKGMYAGQGVGSFFIPSNDDPVWVCFEGGDSRFPIWEYGWFAKDSVPSGATPDTKVIQTTTGQRIELDDKNKLIRIKDSTGNIIELNKNGISVIAGSISLGSLDGSAEKAVLGAALKNVLDSILNAIITHNHPTLGAPAANAAIFTNIKSTLNTILSNKVTLD